MALSSNNIQLPDEVYSLRIGETANLICPVCGGGNNRDKSFSCTRVERGFAFICFRNKCGVRGYQSDTGKNIHTISGGCDSGSLRKKLPPKYTRQVDLVPPEVEEYVYRRYGILPATLAHFSCRWSPPETQTGRVGRLLIPSLAPNGMEHGLVARAIEPTTEPKSLNYTSRPGGMSWFRGEEKSIPVWVVEDQLSAMRLWQYGLTAVALLGTHISHERAVEIKSVSDDVFLALDKDATAKSIGYASTFRYVLNTKVVALSKDVKDMDSNELSNLLKTGCSEWS